MLPLADVDHGDAAKKVRAASKQAGLFGLTQPDSAISKDARQLALCVARETLAAANPPALDAVFGPGAGVLGHVGEPLASTHLAPCSRAKSAAALALPNRMMRSLRGVIKGERLIIDGQKSYVTGGAEADFINTLVRIEGHGPSMVVIDTHTEGVILNKRFNSLDGSHHAAFRFENADVPVTHVIGEPGQGCPRPCGKLATYVYYSPRRPAAISSGSWICCSRICKAPTRTVPHEEKRRGALALRRSAH